MGTTYRVIIEKKRDFPGCPSTEEGTCYGTCDYSTKKIHICGPLFRVDESGQIEDMGHFARAVLRHEIVHAWFYESGQDYFNGNPARIPPPQRRRRRWLDEWRPTSIRD